MSFPRQTIQSWLQFHRSTLPKLYAYTLDGWPNLPGRYVSCRQSESKRSRWAPASGRLTWKPNQMEAWSAPPAFGAAQCHPQRDSQWTRIAGEYFSSQGLLAPVASGATALWVFSFGLAVSCWVSRSSCKPTSYIGLSLLLILFLLNLTEAQMMSTPSYFQKPSPVVGYRSI